MPRIPLAPHERTKGSTPIATLSSSATVHWPRARPSSGPARGASPFRSPRPSSATCPIQEPVAATIPAAPREPPTEFAHMEALQHSVAGARAALAAPVASGNGVAHSAGSSVARVRMGFLSGSASAFKGNAALVARVARAGSGSSSSSSRGVVVMKADTAAGGYAAALADIAQASGDLEKINKDVEGLGELLGNNELYEFLVSPVIDGDKKKSILKTLAEDAQFSDVTLNILNLLVDKKRMELIKEVIKEFEAIYNELTDTQVANVISAVKIEKPQLALIAKKIQSLCGAKNVRIKNVVDPSLIAGFIVQYGKDGSRFIDMSVKGQLDRLASQFAAAEQSAGAF